MGGGFVLRALAGGVAAPVTLSRWFVLVVTFAAVFVAAAKRHAELRRTASDPASGPNGARRVLKRYTPGSLRLLIAGSGASALFAYSIWAFELSDADGVPWRLLSVIPFTACLLRYGALVRTGAGEAPEETLLSDRLLAIGGVLWLVLFAFSVHASGGGREAARPAGRRDHGRVGDRDGLWVGWRQGVSALVLHPRGTGAVRAAVQRGRVPGPDGQATPGVIPRGMGRSYGDAAQLAGGLVLDMTRVADRDRAQGGLSRSCVRRPSCCGAIALVWLAFAETTGPPLAAG